MHMKMLQKDWDALAGQRLEFTRKFYDRLFERYPQYRQMFPETLDAQMEKMVEMFSSIARFADHIDIIRPYLVEAGFAHRKIGIQAEDVENFKNVFIDTLGELCAGWWDAEHDAAWHQAFEDMIVPMFDEGLETGRGKRRA